MSQEDALMDIDAELAELLEEEEHVEEPEQDQPSSSPVKTAVADPAPSEPTGTADAAQPATNDHQVATEATAAAEGGEDAPAREETPGAAHVEGAEPLSGGVKSQPSGGPAKPALATKKRQLLVPSTTAGKRPALQVKQSTTAAKPSSSKTLKPTTEPTALSKPAAAEAILAAAAAAAPCESEASSPAKPSKTTAAVTETTVGKHPAGAAVEPEAGAQGGAAAEEEEVKSPAKTPAAASKPKKRKSLKMTSAPASSTAGTIPTKPKADAAAKPPAAKKAKTEGAAAPAVVKLPTAKSAWLLFLEDKRTEVKAAEPGLSFGEVTKKIGDMYKTLDEETRKVYTDKAAADTGRVKQEIAAMDPAIVSAAKKAAADKKGGKKADKAAAVEAAKAEKAAAVEAAKVEKAAAKEAVKAEKKAEKTAAKKAEKERMAKETAAKRCYHMSVFSATKEANPDADISKINEIIVSGWEKLRTEDKETYFKQAEAQAEAAKAVDASKARKPKMASSDATGRAKSRGSGKRKAAAADESGDDQEEETAAAADDGEDSDREDVDWEEHPATAVFARAAEGKLMVQRRGLGLNEYGIVDARKVRRARVEGTGDELPVSAEMVEQYEQFDKRFWAAVHARTSKNELDLEELEEGSPLEMCYTLGKMQEPGNLLDPNDKDCRGKDKKDFIIRIPGLKLSMAMQCLLELERQQTAAVHKELAAAKQQLASVKQNVLAADSLEEAQEAAHAVAVE